MGWEGWGKEENKFSVGKLGGGGAVVEMKEMAISLPGNFPGGRWAAAGRGPTGSGWSWCPLQYLPFSPVRHPRPPPPLNPASPKRVGGSASAGST